MEQEKESDLAGRVATVDLADDANKGLDDDREVLMIVYDKCGGTSWRMRIAWGSTAHVSSWFGISVREQLQRVSRLSLPWNKLTGGYPGEYMAVEDAGKEQSCTSQEA